MKKRVLGVYTYSPQARDLRENGRIILAHGEVTDHVHEVVCDGVGITDLPAAQYFEEPDGARVLLLTRPCVLRHDEHNPVALDPANQVQFRQGDVFGAPIGQGAWKITRQNEYTPTAIRQVAD